MFRWLTDWWYEGVDAPRSEIRDEDVRRVREQIAERPNSGFESSGDVLADRPDLVSRHGKRHAQRMVELAQQPLHGHSRPEVR